MLPEKSVGGAALPEAAGSVNSALPMEKKGLPWEQVGASHPGREVGCTRSRELAAELQDRASRSWLGQENEGGCAAESKQCAPCWWEVETRCEQG